MMIRRSAALANPWSLQDVRRLRELAQAGVPVESIATMLGRTCAAIRNKAGFHAISLRRAKLATTLDAGAHAQAPLA